METITSAAELKLAIHELEFEHSIQGKLMKEQLFITFDSLKPINLIKSTLDEITSSPYLIDNMLGAVLGMAGGYLSKKIAVGSSHNLIRKVMGAVLQFGVTNVVAQHGDILKSVGDFILKHLFHKNETKIVKT